MKRLVLFGCAVALAAGIFALPAYAASHDGDHPKFKMKGEIRGRWEYWNNRVDAKDTTSVGAGTLSSDQLSFVDYRVRLGVDGRFSERVAGTIEIQNFGVMGGDNPVRGFNDPLRPTSGQSGSGLDLYQGYVTLRYGAFKLRLGRAEHVITRQLNMGNDDFYNGISFDGLRAKIAGDKWAAQCYGYTLTERDLMNAGTPGAFRSKADDTDLYGVDFRWYLSKDESMPGDRFNVVLGYAINANDRFNPATSPTSPIPTWNDANIWTFGAQWWRKSPSGFEWSIEIAGQSGELNTNGPATTMPQIRLGDNVDAKGTIFEGFFGWNLEQGEAASRFSIGALVASGRKPGDGNFEAWIPLFPNIHRDNRLGDLDLFNGQFTNVNSTTAVFPIGSPGGLIDNCSTTPADPYACQQLGMTNVTDIHLRYDYRSTRHDVLAAIHVLAFTEDVRVTAPVSRSESSIGTELDLRYTYKQTKSWHWQVGLANLFSGKALDLTAPGGKADDITRFWLEGRLRWN